MKVLLVTSSYKNAWPFLPELRDVLQKKGILVDVLDVTNLELLTHDNILIENNFLRKLNVLKGGRRLIRFTAKRFIDKNLFNYDAINIHYLEYFYIHLIETFLKHTHNLSFSIWGSDFYRASDSQLLKFLPLFKKANFLSFGNIYTKKDFAKRIPGFDDKLKVANFGIGKFEQLFCLYSQKEILRKKHNLSNDKIVVVCGYNASKAQRHLLLINQIAALPRDIKDKLILILPLTYGGEESYKIDIVSIANKSECEIKVYKGFLSNDEISEIRIIGDIVLNAQVSDTFSASLQEHVLCNAILLAGDWLPYQALTDLGLTYFPVQLEKFGEKLHEIIENYAQFKNKVNSNRELLYKAGTWENRIIAWVDLYTAKKNA